LDRALVLLPVAFVALGLRWLPNIWFVLVPYHLMCLSLPFLEPAHSKRVESLRWVPELRGHVVMTLLTIALGGVLAYWDVLSVLPAFVSAFVSRLTPLGAFAIYSVLVNPFAEEWFWRGFVIDRWGSAESAFWFALLHLLALVSFAPPVLSVVMVLPVFATAVYWGYIRRATGSLWPSVLSHLGVDVAILLALSDGIVHT
jgi:membrane protease YdiL (CAAX protease family)